VPVASYRASLDESSANRGPDHQEYLLCAALVPEEQCDEVHEQLRPLLLPGQIKFHWTDENERRRHEIVSRIVELGPMSIVYSHLDAHRNKTERYRRKTLESVYHGLVALEVVDLTLECRSNTQDGHDIKHIVALQGQGFDKRLRINHLRGGDEPLLWIADAVLGSLDAEYLGENSYMEALRLTLMIEERTPELLVP
jgi:hypothetical protein